MWIFYEMSVHILGTISILQWTPPCPGQGLEGEDLETPFQPKSLPNHHHETMTYDIKFHSLSLSQPQIMRKKMISSSDELFLLLFLSLFGC